MGLRLNHHRRIGIDTMLFVYLIERNHEAFHKRAVEFFDLVYDEGITPVCSTIMITELMQQPLRTHHESVLRQYQQILFHDSTIEFISVTVPVAVRAASLASAYHLKTPDALHIACVVEGGATLFVTADKGIKGLREIEVQYL